MNHELNQDLYDDIRFGTNIIPEVEYIDTLIMIADVAADMVVKTLGPYGKTTMLNDGVFTYPTKDGWSVLKSLRFNDPIYNTLYNVLKQISYDMVSTVGDNTTGAFVAAVKFMHKVISEIDYSGYRQAEVVDAIKHIGDKIISAIESSKYVKHCNRETFDDIRMIANVASNGNDELACMIQDIYLQTKNPNIYVTLGPGLKTSYEIQTGYKLDCNPILLKNYVNTDNGTYIESNPSLVMIFDHTVNYQEHNKMIGEISRYANAVGKSVLILAPHFDDIISHVIGSSIESLLQQGKVPNMMLVQVPLSNSAQRAYLSDMVLLTNGQVIDYGKVRAFNLMTFKHEHPDEKLEDNLLNVAEYHFETTVDMIQACAGQARKVIVGKKYMLLQEYENVVNPKVYKETLKEVEDYYLEMKEKMNKSTTNLYKDYMEAHQHYTKLHGHMGVLKVGGASELEKHYMKDVVDDAVLACRSAFENGYVRGLNLTTMNVIKSISGETPLENEIIDRLFDTFFELSLDVFRNAQSNLDAKHPTTLLTNVGGSFADTIEMSPSDILNYCIENECGYNMITQEIYLDEYCPIINSVKSDTETIRAIVGILSIVLTSNQFLSINRAYDRTMGLKQKQEAIQKNEAAKAGAITDAVIDRIQAKMNLPGLCFAVKK